MRVALNIVKQRRKRLRSLIRAEGFLTIASACERLGISEATARRDLAAVAAKGQITRTRGGGLVNHSFALRCAAAGRGAVPERLGRDAAASEHSAANPLRTTLRDIAERTGFAKTTVSLSLRNNPKIPEVTRQIVRQAARDLGYRPDPALARIAEQRWRARASHPGTTVAFVTTGQSHSVGPSDCLAMEGARNRAGELGYGFEHFRLEKFSNSARLGNVLFHRGIRGMIIGQIREEGFCEGFPWERFSAIGCNTGPIRPPVNVIVPDAAHAMIRAWRHAVDCGYGRIGVALIEGKHPAAELDRLCATLHCQSLLPAGKPTVPILHMRPDDRAEFLGWIGRNGPDAVIGSDSVFLEWMRDAGLKVPEEVGFISLTLAPAGRADLKVAGMDCDMEMIGRAAMEQLDVLIRTNQVGRPSRSFALMVESNWIPGETMGQPARARD